MSHITKISTQFKELDLLAEAIELNGWKVAYHTTARNYYSTSAVYDVVAVNPNDRGYDLGFMADADGTLTCSVDFYDRRIEETFGSKLCRLKQSYSLQLLRRTYPYQQYDVNQLEDGNLQVVVY